MLAHTYIFLKVHTVLVEQSSGIVGQGAFPVLLWALDGQGALLGVYGATESF